MFADRLTEAIRAKGTPVLVGLDPRWDQLPSALTQGGDSPAQRASAYRAFCCEVLDVVAPLVAVVKPQAAFFEELGPQGMLALADVIAFARQKGLLVILDGKRNDIGSTAEAYARGYLGADSPWQADAITVSPYLGDDSLQPFLDVAARQQAGVFVLVKTSNPGGGMLQDLPADGRPLYRHVADYVERLAAASAGESGYGVAGAVVGATYPEQLAELREAMPHTWFLVPGYGSQGATAPDVASAFDDRGTGAVVNNSRGILFAFRRRPLDQQYGEAHWQEAVLAATREMIGQLREHTHARHLRPAG